MRLKNDKGFTLVELIVVIVILAILAAILVPALLGYIDEAKKKQDLLDAKNLLTSVQAEMAKQYSKMDFTDTSKYSSCIFLSNTNGVSDVGTDSVNHDKKINSSSFANNIFERAGFENDRPNFFVIGTGDFNAYIVGDSAKPVSKDNHKPFTVYFAIYRRTATSDMIYYDGNNWLYIPPLQDQGKVNYNGSGVQGAERNHITVGSESVYLQYYVLSNNNGNKQWYQVYREDYKNKNHLP